MKKVKTKFKPLIILIAIFIVTLATGLVAGCTIGDLNAREKADELGMKNCVTYYANGGKFSTTPLCYMSFYFKDNTPIFNIGEDEPADNQTLVISRTGYIFMGWRYCKQDAQGMPLLVDASGNSLKVLENGTADITSADGRQLSEQDKYFEAMADDSRPEVFVDGVHPKISGEAHWYLVATWEVDVQIKYKLVSPTTISGTVDEGKKASSSTDSKEEEKKPEYKEFKTGDVIKSEGFGKTSTSRMINPANFTSENNGSNVMFATKLGTTHSFIHLYYDIECTKPVSVGGDVINKYADDDPEEGPHAEVEIDENGTEHRILYAKYIVGRWTPVRDSNDVNTMLNTSGATNFFMVNDIDYVGTRTTSSKRDTATYRGIIEGNGYTISNLTIEYSNVENASKSSIFGALGAGAEIRNLTLTDVSFTVSVSARASSVDIYALFLGVDTSVKFTAFNINGLKLTISDANNATQNLKPTGSEYRTDRWLYSSSCDDEEFKTNYPGIDVQNATLNINDQDII